MARAPAAGQPLQSALAGSKPHARIDSVLHASVGVSVASGWDGTATCPVQPMRTRGPMTRVHTLQAYRSENGTRERLSRSR
jgi:hypothetical protein